MYNVYTYIVYTVCVQCVYNVCTMCIQSVYNVCIVCIQCVYRVCTMRVQFVYSVRTMREHSVNIVNIKKKIKSKEIKVIWYFILQLQVYLLYQVIFGNYLNKDS